ncbi:hypothetical protein RJT34_25456 [Clitoria ternatea]|uniref:Uncharacterized protein n=1 Tax=Clitoria ternatea TaxID=43366 RepID=A0AAN9FPT6_CLITE
MHMKVQKYFEVHLGLSFIPWLVCYCAQDFSWDAYSSLHCDIFKFYLGRHLMDRSKRPRPNAFSSNLTDITR